MNPAAAIEGSALGQAMRQWLWLYPSVEIVHIVGVALLFGSIAVLDLRLLGFGRKIPVRALAWHVLPWTAASLLLIVPSGLLMFIAHATVMAPNPALRLKLLLVVVAFLNAGIFHRWPFRTVGDWDTEMRAPLAARVNGALSMVLWVSVIACGRLIAYF